MKKGFLVVVGIFCFLSFGMPCYGSEVEDFEEISEVEELEEIGEIEEVEEIETVEELEEFEDYYNAPYAALTLGAVLPQTADYANKLKTVGNSTGIAVAAALGQSFGGWYRGEIELGMQHSKIDNSFVDSGSFMNLTAFVNAYLDFPNEGPFTPFVTGGVGCVRFSHDKLKLTNGGSIKADNAIVFGWQLGAGLGIELDEKNSIDLRYRYFHSAAPNLKAIEDMKNNSHSILLTIRHDFSVWK